MGDDKGGAALHQPVHALLHQLLCAGVDGGRGLVQDQDRRVRNGGAGDGEELPLALAQIGPIAGEDCLVAIRKPPDKAVGVGQLRGGNALLIGGLQPPVADILHHCASKQVGVLQDDAQGAAKVGFPDFVDIDAVIADFAVLNIVEAIDQIGDGGLSRAGTAHKGDLLSGCGKEFDVVQDDFFIVVAEVHIVKDNIALQLFVGDCAIRFVGVPPGPQARPPGCFRQSIRNPPHDLSAVPRGPETGAGVLQL